MSRGSLPPKVPPAHPCRPGVPQGNQRLAPRPSWRCAAPGGRRPRATPGLGQRQQHALRVDQPAEPVHVPQHVLGIDHQLLDDAGQPRQARSRASPWRPGRSCARPTNARCRARARARHPPSPGSKAADHAREPGQVLGQHRVALVRHRRRAFLAGREILLRLQDLGALQMADLGGQPLDRRRDHAERREIHGVAVARDHLRRYRLGPSGRALPRHAPRRAGRCWRRCRPRRRSRRSRPRRGPPPAARRQRANSA